MPENDHGFSSLFKLGLYFSFFKISLKNYFSVLKSSIIFILILVLIKGFNDFFLDTPGSGYTHMDLAIEIIVSFLLIFFWSCSLRATHEFFKEKKTSMIPILWDTLAVSHKILLAAAGFVAIFFIFLLFAYSVLKGSTILGFFFFLLPVFFLNVLFYFTIPILLFHNTSVFSAFRESAEMVRLQNWLPTFGLYFFSFFAVIIVSPTTLHEHILETYYLNIPFDFIVLSILLPLLNSLIVLFENNFKRTEI